MGSVKPFSTGDIAIPIQTKLGIGQYWARISAYRDETVQKEENLVFEIVPVGSLQKTGNLKDLICAKTAAIGETIKINGVFENTGLSDYSAKLVAEIYKNDKLIKLVESDLADVTAGKTENLSAYFAPEEPGEYTVKAHVAYSGKKTPEKETQVLVRNAVLLASLASFGLSGFMPWAAIFILFLIVVIIIMAVIFKKRNTNKTRQLTAL